MVFALEQPRREGRHKWEIRMSRFKCHAELSTLCWGNPVSKALLHLGDVREAFPEEVTNISSESQQKGLLGKNGFFMPGK